MNKIPSYLNFDNENYYWKSDINYRENPEFYKIGKGEQGVLMCQPYKSEILQYWRFKTPEIAEKSSQIIYNLFKEYIKNEDYIGADMARKFLQMGYTRARRYYNYKAGRKYDENYQQKEIETGDPQKAISAQIFYEKWKEAESDPIYYKWKLDWKKKYG